MKIAVTAALLFVAVAFTNFVSVSGRPSETETNTNINTNSNRDTNIIDNLVLNEVINALLNLQLKLPTVDEHGITKIDHQVKPTGDHSGAIVKRSTNTNINTNDNRNTNIIDNLILNEIITALLNLQINSKPKISHHPTQTDARSGFVVPRSTNTNINTNSNSNTNVDIVELINVIINALLNVNVQELEKRKLGLLKASRP